MSGFDSIVVDAAEGAVSLVPGGGILVAAGTAAIVILNAVLTAT